MLSFALLFLSVMIGCERQNCEYVPLVTGADAFLPVYTTAASVPDCAGL
jgi:hypothetical protein